MGDTTAGWKSFRPIYVNGAAYGGLIGTPGAFISFAQDFLRPEGRLLSRAQRDEMFSENRLNNGKASGMCLGWFCSHLNGHRFVAHAGGGGGFYCELRVYPETGMGSILMTNRSGFSDERLLNGFTRIYWRNSLLFSLRQRWNGLQAVGICAVYGAIRQNKRCKHPLSRRPEGHSTPRLPDSARF